MMKTEKRLIDANAFFDKLKKLAELMRQGKIGEIDLDLLIASMPTVDAVPVVRCKDCKHLYIGMDDYCCISHRGLARICESSFCSYGERKDNEKG